ncbi:pseudouridine synthase family protein [Mycoplasmopsis felis]|uniref:pseudouridine synthase family protein n=1 Tax=Mycoplasmopsis felis TaxID=33923 RepID=UPI003A4E0A8E
MFEIKATKNDSQRTIFKVICKYLNNIPISKIESLFRKKDIKINGNRKINKDDKVNENDIVVVYGIKDWKKITNFSKIPFDFKIIYEDDNLLVIDKKNGVEVHGTDDCLDLQVLSYLNYKYNDSFIPSHIGRLDKETSGLILYGKNYMTVSKFNNTQSLFTKRYIFKSDFNESRNIVDLYFYKDKTGKIKVSKNKTDKSKYAQTLLYTENNKKYAELKTGRKHQIRLTLKYLGKPIYGDKKYGGKIAERLMLHSYYIKLNGLDGELKYLNNLEFYSHPKW